MQGHRLDEMDTGHIAFLLQELDKWVAQGLLPQDSYQALHSEYNAHYEQALRLERFNALLTESKAALSQGMLNEALEKASESLAISPNSVPAMIQTAKTYERLGRLDESQSLLESICDIEPENTAVKDHLLYITRVLEEKKHAGELSKALANIAEIARSQGFDAAISECESFIEKNPSVAKAHALLSSFYAATERIDDAIASINNALTLSPGESQFSMQLNQLQRNKTEQEQKELRQQQIANAERLRTQAIARSKELTAQAEELLRAGQFDNALKIAKSAAEFDRDNASARAIAAQVYMKQGSWQQAENEWSAAVRLDNQNAEYAEGLRTAIEKREYFARPLLSRLWDKGSAALESFMEERNIQWMHMLGAAILIAGIIGIGAWVVTIQKLWGPVGKGLIAILPLILSAGFYYGGYRLRSTLSATATSFHAIASVLLPIDLVIAKNLFPKLITADWSHYGLIISLVSTLTYLLVLSSVRSRLLAAFAGIGFLSTLFFSLSSFTKFTPSEYGMCFAVVGFAYLMLAHTIRRRGLAPFDVPFDVLAHVSMAGALASTMIGGIASKSGMNPAFTVLAVSLVYVLAAYLVDQSKYIPIFAIVLLGFIVFGLKSSGFGITDWYQFALGISILGCIFLGLVPISRRQDKEDFADYYQWLGFAITALVVLAAFGRGLLSVTLPGFLPKGAELQTSLYMCLMISIFYAFGSIWTSKPRMMYGAALIFTYSSLLFVRLMDRPGYEYAVWMLVPTVILMGFGWLTRQKWAEHSQIAARSGRILAAICGVTATYLWGYNSLMARVHSVAPQQGYANAVWAVALFSAVYYALIARSSSKIAYIYTSIISAFVWWTASFTWLENHTLKALLRHESNFGLYYLPLVVGMLLIGRYLNSRQKQEFAKPFDISSMLLALGSIVLEGFYINSASNPMHHSIWIALIAYAGVFAWQAYTRKEDDFFGLNAAAVCTYASMASLWTGIFYALNGFGVQRPITAVVSMLFGSIGVSLAAQILENKGESRWTRPLLVSAAGVFAYTCYYGVLGGNIVAGFFAFGLVAGYSAWVYSTEESISAQWTLPGIGIGFLLSSALLYNTQLPTTVAVASGLTLSGFAFAVLSGKMRSRIHAYIATLSFAEAAAILLFHFTEGLAITGLHRLGLVAISALLLIAGLILSRKRSELAQAPFVVGHALLAANIIATTLNWASFTSDQNRLITLLVAAAGAIIYGLSTLGFKSRWFLYPFVATLSFAYGLAGAQWIRPLVAARHANYGLWFVPIVVAFAVGGHILQKRRLPAFANILHFGALGLVMLSLSLQTMYSHLTVFIALFAYASIWAWGAVAGRRWEIPVSFDRLSEFSTYAASTLFVLGWITMFQYIGSALHRVDFYNSIAAATGMVLCFAALGVSKLLSDRDFEWWARPLFWSANVFASVFVIWAVCWQQAAPMISLATVTVSIVFYTLVSMLRRGAEFGYWGVLSFTLGYIWIFDSVSSMHGISSPVKSAILGLSVTVASVCAAYISRMVRSKVFAYMASIGTVVSYAHFLDAIIDASGTQRDGWYGIGAAFLTLSMLAVSKYLRNRDLPELADAPAKIGVLVTSLVAISEFIGSSWNYNFDRFDNYLGVTANALCAIAYSLSALTRRIPMHLYFATLTMTAGWGLVEWSRLLRIHQDNDGLFYIPLVLIFGVISYYLRAKRRENYARPMWWSALVLSLWCALLQFDSGEWGLWSTIPVTLFVLSAAYAVASYLEKESKRRVELMTYLACASFIAGVVSIPWPKEWVSVVSPLIPVVIAVLGILWAALASRLSTLGRDVWVRPLMVCAGVTEAFSVVAPVTVLHHTSIVWNTIAVIAAISTITWMSRRIKNEILIHVAGILSVAGSVGLMYYSYHHHTVNEWLYLVPLMFSAVGAAMLAIVGESKESAIWSPALLFTGFIAFIGHSGEQLLSPGLIYCGIFVAAMGICAVAYHQLIKRLEVPELELAGAIAGFISYWYALVLIGNIPHVDYSPVSYPAISILPFAALLVWLCRNSISRPYGAVAMTLSVIGVASGLLSDDSSMSFAAMTFILYAIGYGVTAARYRTMPVAYLSNVTMLIAWHTLYLALKLPDAGSSMPVYGAWFALLGLLYVCAGLVLNYKFDQKYFAKTQFLFGAGLTTIAAMVALVNTPSQKELGQWTVAALLCHAIAYAMIAMVYRRMKFVHIGFAGVLISLYIVFYGKLKLDVLDIYALPIGIYLLSMPSISKLIGSKINANPFYSAGLTIMLGSGLLTIMMSENGFNSWNSYLMLIESVAAFLYGLSRRKKEFFFFGSGFAAIWVAVLIRNSVIRGMHGGGTLVAGIIGIVVGTGLIVFASFSEQKRAQVLASIRRAAESFRNWE